MNILFFKFKHRNIWYYVEYNGKSFTYYSMINGQKNYDLKEDEIELINQIINRLTPSSSLYELSDLTINGINYNIIYDRYTNFKFIATQKQSDILNKIIYLFNNEDVCLYNEQNESNPQDNNFFKRIVKLGKYTFIVFISIASLITIINIAKKPFISCVGPNYYASIETKMDESAKIPIEEIFKKLDSAIDNNTNLSDKEKETIKEVIRSLKDSKNFLDVDKLEKKLSCLRIYYDPDEHGITAGYYHTVLNYIKCYLATDIEDADPATVYHEMSHVLQEGDLLSRNLFFIEATNTIYTDEYLCCDKGYSKCVDYTKALMEIIGSEPLLKFHNFTSTQIIIDALCEIDDDEERAINLVEDLDIFKKIIESNWSFSDETIEAYKKRITDSLAHYYQKKYNRSMYDDIVMLSYLDTNAFKEKLVILLGLKNDPGKTYHTIEVTNLIKYFNKSANNGNRLLRIVIKNQEGVVISDFYLTSDIRYLPEQETANYRKPYNKRRSNYV